MHIETSPSTEPAIIYPESDGKPMADNTKQFRYIVMIQGGFDALFADRPDVFVAGDLLWYPVEGQAGTCQAPDTMVVFGRPKGDRGSYKQWEEENIAPQVVFEILSPNNRVAEMVRKWRFYERHGVEEYYVYDPDRGDLSAYIRSGSELTEIEAPIGWVSPRTGVRFELERGELCLYRPDGRRFATYLELEAQRQLAQQQAMEAQQQAMEAQQQATEAQQQAAEAQQRADQERREREAAEATAARLAARLRELGVDLDDHA